MPELPEVERARKALASIALGKQIAKVITFEDPIVFSGVTHTEFVTLCEGQTVIDVKRKGKNFYLILSGSNHPIFHFGMTGTSHVRGIISPNYQRASSKTSRKKKMRRKKSNEDEQIGEDEEEEEEEEEEEWPPKYIKAIFNFIDPKTKQLAGEWAFCDARRLGRIKLVEIKPTTPPPHNHKMKVDKDVTTFASSGDPKDVPPLSLLGADPLLDMPSVEELSIALLKRHAPIKAVLLDQNGPLCGIGNWMVDEILFQARLHPSHPSSALSQGELSTLHAQIQAITLTAVEANADSKLFPKHWLFSSRWGKGRGGGGGGGSDGKSGKKRNEFILPNGEVTSISFITVGGRTSAVIEAVQRLPSKLEIPTTASKISSKPVKKTIKRKAETPLIQSHEEDNKSLGERNKTKKTMTNGNRMVNKVSMTEAIVAQPKTTSENVKNRTRTMRQRKVKTSQSN